MLYESLNNVLTHFHKELGTVITHYDPTDHILNFTPTKRLIRQKSWPIALM